MQAQDYRWAKWSIALRTDEPDEQAVEQAIETGAIVRTWLFRGTLHFVAADDLPWLTALLAPGILRGNARRYRQLGLDDATIASSHDTIRRALEARGALTRAEIASHLKEAGLPAEGQQVPYLLQRAALDGLICHGPQRGTEPEYVLLAGRGNVGPSLDRRDALARLTARYLAGHGPATRHDLAWWAGLTAADARLALETAPEAIPVEFDGVDYWVTGEPPASASRSGCLLPRFDEYLLGYRDRSLVLDPAYARRVNPGGGMPQHTVMVDGDIIGTWRSAVKNQKLVITVTPFVAPTPHQRDTIERAATRFGRYAILPVDLHLAPASAPS